MAVTRKGHSLVFTANGDAYQFPVRVKQIRFIGTGLTPGQVLTLKEVDTNGAVIASHPVLAAQEDTPILEMDSWVRRPFIDAAPAAGTWQVLFQLA